MRHALAHDVVERHERARFSHRLRDGNREQPGVREQRSDQLVRKVRERLVMVAWNEQRVAREERPVVEERDRPVILEDQMSRLVTGDDLAEAAVRIRLAKSAILSERGGPRRVDPSDDISRKGRSGRATVLVLSLGVLAALIVLAPGTAGAGTAIKRGTYSGKTDQDAVATGFRPAPVHGEQGEGDPDHRADRRPRALPVDRRLHAGRDLEQEARAKPDIHHHAHLLRQQDRQDPRPVRELERNRGIRDLPLLRAGPLLEGETKVNFTAKHK